ncbi:MAG: glycoside hydrolase family 2 protein [Bacteroidetes bacterium]|nr:glycoside hydrolase family 2 protein [Bacteroidota bacterium]
MISYRSIISSLLFFLIANYSDAQIIPLSNWTFKQSTSKKWLPAQVPGVTHTDLLRNKIIKDPLVDDNENKVQWVGEASWDYKCDFTCDESVLLKPQLHLIFDGLDTYADVYLNDSLILRADNMFRSWKVNVKEILRKKNTLLVKFKSPEAEAKVAAQKLNYTLPEGLRSFTRKAQFHYGWDFAPKILTCGVWKAVNLVAENNIALNSIRVLSKMSIGDTVIGKAFVKINSTVQQKTYLTLNIIGTDVRLIHEVNIQRGEQTVNIPFVFPNAQRWQINGRGEQPIYELVCRLEEDTMNQVACKTGFRTVELKTNTDAIGSEFGFRINGKDVFVRGANMIPPDVFLPNVSDDEYKSLVLKAKEAGMNMLRIWGGGVYLPESFYNYCDQYGIMVWQDFMFACSMIPGDSAFVDNVRSEAIQQVERLSSHPCIVLWCGNNESDEGWHNWGWQKQFNYSSTDSAKIWNDYKNVFQSILPDVVDSIHPTCSYWSSSPSIGWGRKESMLSGDSHYWGVWWGMEDFEVYKKKTGRFMSEYGFQSMADVSSYRSSISKIDFSSPAFLNHQKHPKGFETINEYLKRYFKVPTAIDDYAYLSQLQQAYGMDIATKAHRSAFPICRGTLFWQFNDSWPAVSWSSLSKNIKPKLVYSTVKHNFDALFVTTAETERGLSTYLHYDGQDPISITVRLYYIRTDTLTEPISIDERYLILNPDTVIKDCIFFPRHQMRNLDTNHIVIVTEVLDNFHFNVIYRDYLFRDRPNKMAFHPAKLKIENIDATSLIITSNVFTYGLYFYDEEGKCTFDNNGIHLMPNERKLINFSGPADKIKWKCWNNVK